MFRKLHTRLIVSHALPVLILAPALIVVLLYLLETHHSVGDLADQLTGQGTLIIQIAQITTSAWNDPSAAQQVIQQVKPNISSRIMLLTKDGQLLASSLDSDNNRVGQKLAFPVITQAIQGQTNWLIDYSPFMKTRILDMAIPVFDNNTSVIGIVRLSYDITAIEQRTLPLSGALAITFMIGSVLALLFSIGLARSLNAPLLHLTEAVSVLTPGRYMQDIPETGPDELKIVAQNYNKMTHRLHELEQARQQLIANVVHELGTPLGAIKAAADALRNGATLDQSLATDLALGINSQIDQMRLLIDDLALLGESEIKEITLHRDWCNLEELIQTQCHLYAYLAKQKRITLSYDVRTDLPPAFVDMQRIKQVLANLLHNAYKYCPAGCQISVSAYLQTGPRQCVVIEVSDNGPGIAVEEQSKIFDVLYRSPNQRNLHKGMGIGLALSKRLVDAHGGSINVKSTLGQGATFTVSIPTQPS